MAVTEVSKRRLAIQQCQDRLAIWDKHLNDQDWIERLTENLDFKKLCELYKADMAETNSELESMKTMLLTQPMKPDEAIKVRECVMLMERDRTNADNFISFPGRETSRLDEIRKEYPKVKEQLKELESMEGNHG